MKSLYRLVCLVPSDHCYFSYQYFEEYFDSLHLALKFFTLYGYKECGCAIYKGVELVVRW